MDEASLLLDFGTGILDIVGLNGNLKWSLILDNSFRKIIFFVHRKCILKKRLNFIFSTQKCSHILQIITKRTIQITPKVSS